jgi:hypothetical protein
LATFQKIGRFFPNHLVTLVAAFELLDLNRVFLNCATGIKPN